MHYSIKQFTFYGTLFQKMGFIHWMISLSTFKHSLIDYLEAFHKKESNPGGCFLLEKLSQLTILMQTGYQRVVNIKKLWNAQNPCLWVSLRTGIISTADAFAINEDPRNRGSTGKCLEVRLNFGHLWFVFNLPDTVLVFWEIVRRKGVLRFGTERTIRLREDHDLLGAN